MKVVGFFIAYDLENTPTKQYNDDHFCDYKKFFSKE